MGRRAARGGGGAQLGRRGACALDVCGWPALSGIVDAKGGVCEVAQQEGVSINQLINSAVAEKLAALMTEKYFKERLARADRKKVEAVLGKILTCLPFRVTIIHLPLTRWPTRCCSGRGRRAVDRRRASEQLGGVPAAERRAVRQTRHREPDGVLGCP